MAIKFRPKKPKLHWFLQGIEKHWADTRSTERIYFLFSYEFAQRWNVVLDDYRMSFVINIGTWLVSLGCLNTLIMMKSVTENVIPDVLCQEHLPSSNRWKNVKNDMPHQSSCEIYTCSSWWIRLVTCSNRNLVQLFRLLLERFKQYVVVNNQYVGCSHFFWTTRYIWYQVEWQF